MQGTLPNGAKLGPNQPTAWRKAFMLARAHQDS